MGNPDDEKTSVAIALALLQQRMDDVLKMVGDMRSDMKQQTEEFRNSLKSSEARLSADVAQRAKRTDERFSEIEERLNSKAEMTEFRLVRAVVFGFVGLVLVAVASALIATVV